MLFFWCRIQSKLSHCISSSCLFGFLRSGSVFQSFLAFHDLNILDQHLYHGIQGPPKPCSLSCFIPSQVTCIPVTPGGHTVFKHAIHNDELLYVSGIPYVWNALPLPDQISSHHHQYHCPLRIHQSLFCVPMVLCSSCYSSADLI